MENLKIAPLIFFTIVILASCATNKNNVYWISGTKTDCSAGAGKMQCLNVYKGDKLENAQWQNFYVPIEGFEFEEGILKKIEVKEERLDPKTVSADASSIKYTLVKVLEKIADKQPLLNGNWTLVKYEDRPINRMEALPTLEINTAEKQISGNGGCNQYMASITNTTQTKIAIGAVARTRKACIGANMESQYFEALEKIRTYLVDGKMLTLLDAKNKPVLSFIKNEKPQANQRLHDIWIGIRINGNPINRMTPAPRLEINLTEMRVMGNNGCNDFHGAIEKITDTELLLANIAVTQKMCARMETADAFNKAINHVATYQLDKRQLMFYDKDGNEILAFLKTD